jgi:hypothetical protein
MPRRPDPRLKYKLTINLNEVTYRALRNYRQYKYGASLMPPPESWIVRDMIVRLLKEEKFLD